MKPNIIHFDITLKLRDRKQVETLVEYLVNNDITFQYVPFPCDDIEVDYSEIVIGNHCWMDNLVEIGQLLRPLEFTD